MKFEGLSVLTVNKAVRYTFACLHIGDAFLSSNALFFSWTSNTLSQSAEKRACVTAIINLLSELSRYVLSGIRISFRMSKVQAILLVLWRFY